MAALILPHRWRQQPPPGGTRQPHAEWLGRGLVALFDTSAALELITGTRATDTSGRVITSRGVGADFSGTANQQYAHHPVFAQLGALSIVVFCDLNTGPAFSLISKSSTLTTNCPYFVYNNGSNLLLRRSAGASSSLHTYGYTQSAPVYGQMFGVSATGIAGAATVKGYLNATQVSMTANELVPTDVGDSVWIGRSQDARQLNGRIYYIGLFNRALAAAEFRALYENPWQIFRSAPARIWVSAAGGGTSFKPTWAANANTLIGA